MICIYSCFSLSAAIDFAIAQLMLLVMHKVYIVVCGQTKFLNYGHLLMNWCPTPMLLHYHIIFDIYLFILFIYFCIYLIIFLFFTFTIYSFLVWIRVRVSVCQQSFLLPLAFWQCQCVSSNFYCHELLWRCQSVSRYCRCQAVGWQCQPVSRTFRVPWPSVSI